MPPPLWEALKTYLGYLFEPCAIPGTYTTIIYPNGTYIYHTVALRGPQKANP